MDHQQQDVQQGSLEISAQPSPQKAITPGARRRSMPELEELARADCAIELYRMLGSSKARKGNRSSCTGGHNGSSSGTASGASSAHYTVSSVSARKLAFANSTSNPGIADAQQQGTVSGQAQPSTQTLENRSSVSSSLPVFTPAAQARQNAATPAPASHEHTVDPAAAEANSKLGTRNSVPLIITAVLRPPGGSPTSSPNHRRASVATCGTYSTTPHPNMVNASDSTGEDGDVAQNQIGEERPTYSNSQSPAKHRTSVPKGRLGGLGPERSSCSAIAPGASGSSILMALGAGSRSGRRRSTAHRRSATGSDTLAALRAACDYLGSHGHGSAHHHITGSRESLHSILAAGSTANGTHASTSSSIPVTLLQVSPPLGSKVTNPAVASLAGKATDPATDTFTAASAGSNSVGTAVSVVLGVGQASDQELHAVPGSSAAQSTPAAAETPVKHICTGYHCSVCGVGPTTHACTGYNCEVCGVAAVAAETAAAAAAGGHVCMGYNCEICGVPAMSRKPTMAGSASLSSKLPCLPGGIDDDDLEFDAGRSQASMTRRDAMAMDTLMRTGSGSQAALDQQLLSGYSSKTLKHSPCNSPASDSLNRSSNSGDTGLTDLVSDAAVTRNGTLDHVLDGVDGPMEFEPKSGTTILGSNKRNLSAAMVRTPTKHSGSENRHLLSPSSKLGPGSLVGRQLSGARKAADMGMDADRDDLPQVPVVAAMGCLPARWLH